MTMLAGGCQCGAVRYALRSMPKASLCHCRMCQRAVGGPFAALAELPVADLEWTHGAPALFRSSDIAQRGFCAACGTPLTYQNDEGVQIEVTIASLDWPDAVAPDYQVGIESRLAWVEGMNALPARTSSSKYDSVTSFQASSSSVRT